MAQIVASIAFNLPFITAPHNNNIISIKTHLPYYLTPSLPRPVPRHLSTVTFSNLNHEDVTLSLSIAGNNKLSFTQPGQYKIFAMKFNQTAITNFQAVTIINKCMWINMITVWSRSWSLRTASNTSKIRISIFKPELSGTLYSVLLLSKLSPSSQNIIAGTAEMSQR